MSVVKGLKKVAIRNVEELKGQKGMIELKIIQYV